MSDKYVGWYGAIDKRTIDTNTQWPMVYTDLWPLTASSLDNKLGFMPRTVNQGLEFSTMTTMPNPPTPAKLMVDSPPGAGNSKLREYNPQISNDTSNYITYLGNDTQTLSYITDSRLLQERPSPSKPSPFGINIFTDFHDRVSSFGASFCQNQDDNTVSTLFFTDADAAGQRCKWRTKEEAFACCTFPQPLPSDFNSKCGPAFIPGETGRSLCVPLMLDICEQNWETEACQQYLSSVENNPDVKQIVQTTIKNYINQQAQRTGCGGNDYTTPSINSCVIKSGKDRGKYRDDSQDQFLTETLVSLCNATSKAGVCDAILDQYCAQFTRDDVYKDATLLNLCGCHLRTCAMENGICKPNVEDTGLVLSQKPIDKEQYVYPGLTKTCDPLCASPNVISTSEQPACNQTVCIMDSVGINLINSQCEDAKISIVCGADYSNQNGTGSCYIDSSHINIINSECGKAYISQNCGNCFVYEKGSGKPAQKVDCGNINQPGKPGGNGGDKSDKQTIKDMIKAHPYLFGIFGTLFLLIMIFGILFLVSK
jgi:hypothetical protein